MILIGQWLFPWIGLSGRFGLKLSLFRLNETDDRRHGIGQGRRCDFGGALRRGNERHVALWRRDMERENRSGQKSDQ